MELLIKLLVVGFITTWFSWAVADNLAMYKNDNMRNYAARFGGF